MLAIQLYPAGRQTSSKTSGYDPIFAPSPIPTPGEEEIPREATVEEIQGVVEAFGEGAQLLTVRLRYGRERGLLR